LTGVTHRMPLSALIESADEIATLIRQRLGDRAISSGQA
jgi:hypothetical protein